MVFQNNLLAGASGASGTGFDTTLIGNSVWFDSGDYLDQDTAAADSSRKEAIFSTWVQRTSFGAQGFLLAVNGSNSNDHLTLDWQADNTLHLTAYASTVLATSQVFRDMGWYHILVTIDTSQNSNASQKIFVNGEEVTSFATRNNLGSSADIGWGRNQTHLVNSSPTSVGSNQMIGYLAQTALITDKSFQQSDYSISDFLDTFTFGTNGSQFIPKKNSDIATIVGAGGNNSFLLTFENASDLGNDGSSKNNDFTANNMSSANQSISTPSKTYSTFNPLAHADNSYPGTFTLSEGNQKNVINSSNTSVKTTVPFLMSGSNIIRAQFTFSTLGDGGCGITGSSHTAGTYHTAGNSIAGRGEVGLCGNGALVIDGNFNNSYTSALSNGDVVDVIVNCDVGAVYFAVDGTLLGGATQSEILAGTTTNAALVSSFVRRTAGEVFNFYAFQFNPTSTTIEYNSGQKSFTHSYSTITSLKSLNTADLPAPTYQGIDYFNSVKYTGTSGGSLVSRTDGTPIGDMTSGGGLAAAFDGDIENYASGAYRGGTSADIGKDWGSGVTKTITGVVVRMLGNATIDGGAAAETVTLTVQRSDNGSDWTQIFTESGITVAAAAVVTRKSGFSNTAAARYVRIVLSHGGGAETHVSELEFYENGSDTNAVTGIGWKPDLVWIKDKGTSAGVDHALYDIVRGVTKQLESNTGTAESTETQGLTAFGSDGFTVGTNDQVNAGGATFISWNWLASNSTSTTSPAGTIASTTSVASAGHFSVGTYTGQTGAGTVGHGLGGEAEMVIVWDKGFDNSIAVYHVGVASDAETDYLLLNQADAATDDATFWNDTAPTSSVFSVGTGNNTNGNGRAKSFLAFRSVPGVCKVGSYEGNNSSDGTYISLGFKCRWLLVKNVDTAGQDWRIYDSVIEPINPNDQFFKANTNAAQISSSGFDFLSDGVKARDNNAGFNSSATFVYMAMADLGGNGTLPPIYGR